MNNPGPRGEQQMQPLDYDQTTKVCCDKCKHDVFVQVFKIRKVSALISPTGQEAKIPVPLFACKECGHINEEFMPRKSSPSPLEGRGPVVSKPPSE